MSATETIVEENKKEEAETSVKPEVEASESQASESQASESQASEEKQEKPVRQTRGRKRKSADEDKAPEQEKLNKPDEGVKNSSNSHEERSDGDEEHVARRGKARNKRNGERGRKRRFEQEEEPESDEFAGITLHLRDVSEMTPAVLLAKADSLGIDNVAGMRKQEQVSAILRAHAKRG
ncbi:MAG: Rho termination factor N-terminal domain-containing protein, partial [Mariprofundaceae bacterium]